MYDKPMRTLKQRVAPLAVVAVTLGAIVGFSQLGANLNNGAAAKPAPRQDVPALSSPGGNARGPAATKAAISRYWTNARMNNARAVLPDRDGNFSESYGSSVLDFTRSRIIPQTANTAVPNRATGKLFFTAGNGGSYVCSASVIANRLLITAGHCIHNSQTGGWSSNWMFIPGYDGTRATQAQREPFGRWFASGNGVRTDWVNNQSLPNPVDFGVLSMFDNTINGVPTKIADVVGKYKFSLNHLSDNHVTMLGYPCNFDSCNIMQRVDSGDHRLPPGFTSSVNAYEYGSDMTGGSSGGPWLENFGTGSSAPQGSWATRNAVVAVTSYGYLDNGASLVQGASQLNSAWQSLYDWACTWATGNC